jgi:signal transduction histidine kinase
MQSGRHTFLIVDDEPAMLESLRHFFRREYAVVTAPNGRQALEILDQQEAHVILSDQRMPGMSGDEFLARAREVQPDAIRLLFTGYADLEAVISAVNKGGIFRYILKPWEPAEIESVVRQAARQYELLVERRRLIADLQAANERLSRANEDLALANQLKTAFLEVASHEFNTPITIVQGLAELLCLMSPERDAQETAILKQISEGTRQLARLVATTLHMVESDNFKRALETRPTDLGDLLRRAADQVGPFVTARGLRFNVDLAGDLGMVRIDADKIRDAVLNLLSNAIKFTPDGGELALEARCADADWVEIVVSDKGIGLEPRALAHLFDPFFTEFDPSHHSTGDFGFRKRGLGLGLSLVKKFVELHGGEVRAQSALGSGTRIALRLPRGSGPSAVSG